MNSRPVVAALAHTRAAWPTSIATWTTSGTLGLEFLLCLSAAELVATLASGRQVDAVLVDSTSSQVDRDLVSSIRRSGATPIGIEAGAPGGEWEALDVHDVLSDSFGPDDLLEVLGRCCSAGSLAERRRSRVELPTPDDPTPLVAVCGTGGAGASTVAMATAQAMASDHPRIVLVDGAPRAHLAMYHDTGDVIPGLGDLVALARNGSIDPADVPRFTHETRRGYRLLLGSPTTREARRLPASSTAEAIDAVARSSDLVVVDHDGDHWANTIAAALVDRCSTWTVVTTADMRGLHGAARLVAEAVEAGVPQNRVLVLCNRVRRSDARRLRFASDLAALLPDLDPPACGFVPAARLDPVHRDVSALPTSVAEAAARAVRRCLSHTGVRGETPNGPRLTEARL